MFTWILQKTVGTRTERQLRKLWPLVREVNQIEESLQQLTDDELQARTGQFQERLRNGETVEDVLCEAFATVKSACRRLVGRTIQVTGHDIVWDMVPFDVQVLGAVVLHRGGIAEMATGEGKTLVATMPLYLNALTGNNTQLVTVNDYLARRDSEWMGAVYAFLGLTVGCIQNSMAPPERREQYACDITYGTNSEFGFDYLRDMGMAMSREEMVQRGHFYAIIDEIDSILIDEARTPLIISGPAAISTHRYDKLKPLVAELFRQQSLHCARLVQEARKVFDREDASDEELDEALVDLCRVRLGMPKQKQLMRINEDPSIRKQVERKELEIHSDNNRGFLQQVKETLFFSIDERGGEADLSEKGRQHLRPDDPDAFVIPDLATMLSEIEVSTSGLSEEERTEKRQKAQERFDIQSETIHNISQLLRAYCLFEKDVQYVVQENKVVIVDEFTGRPMPGRRFSEGLHQALEAKEGVQIERETQTLASVTIQNYFRMYDKLAGMTGTAETEATEFKQIYDLDVLVVPTNRPCVRADNDDRIYKTKREKLNAIVEEIDECHKRGQPTLVGTVSVDVSEVLSRMLQRRRIPHNVLNAKHHQQEADVVTRAGKRGAVTIATNMAGRGTDIKLGDGVKDAGGLHVIGSERHDARRIDRQLRGRCARQGDPGSSRFYISLEDNLMRLFGSDRVASIMEKLGLEEGEELSHKLLNRSIERAQRRVEQQHFSIRKRTLEYDDVINKQREVVYGLRRDILLTDDPRGMVFDFVYTAISERIEDAVATTTRNQLVEVGELRGWLQRTFPIRFQDEDFEYPGDPDAFSRGIADRIDQAYQLKEKNEGEDSLRWLEVQIMLNAIDSLYQEHLYAMDALRHGVQLRSYGQRDPLVEYKQEAYGMFAELMDRVKEQVCSNLFRSATTLAAFRQLMASVPQEEVHDQFGQFGGIAAAQGEEGAEAGLPMGITIRRQLPKVGRNDPCSCGSGKKYKKCCGR
ncbi:MAG: preprotein translocase subunit SecA [Lentisphaerae bacterium]|jgi:preprotein translocase subunit SecA|nr:preprotein translocase subunit SecA [Lentisphaerota bacterium]MBT5607270.1 preprotein translocase subunit SecA [Lentisphaerota bacterium]MBT7058801.1 preprotein translocase subunit SecA [Lentisphaerota bacterium]MBT7842389.1 preprotein translocase subunit SecA [Lentisphaerota bacterium]